MAAITLPSVQRYCERHRYALMYDPNVPEQEKDACKARLFLTAYHSGKFTVDDIALWLDTDALVMNSAICMPTLNEKEFSGRHFLWSYDWNGPNSGVWIARFSSKAAHFIQTYDYLAKAMGWGDQWGMNETMLLPPFRDWVDCVPGKWMNCNLYDVHGMGDWPHKNEINNYEEGDWILHLAGIEYSKRMELLRHYAKLMK